MILKDLIFSSLQKYHIFLHFLDSMFECFCRDVKTLFYLANDLYFRYKFIYLNFIDYINLHY
jgi:hypothetical protein